MLNNNTINEIQTNDNPGVEYEIALFYRLLQIKPDEASRVLSAIESRHDSERVMEIVSHSDPQRILQQLGTVDYTLTDVSFETQNDEVGPADLVLHVKGTDGVPKKVGLSVKYSNTCTLNVTGRRFITDAQIAELKGRLPEFTKKYISEMTGLYGDVDRWFRQRKPSKITDEYIDMIRDAVIKNWPNVENKSALLGNLFHADSPIDFWVVTYGKQGYTLKTIPETIESSRAAEVTVSKLDTSYVAFNLGEKRIGHMQVKFNNGFIERCKKSNPDIVWQGVRMAYGQPFSSWNFSTEK